MFEILPWLLPSDLRTFLLRTDKWGPLCCVAAQTGDKLGWKGLAEMFVLPYILHPQPEDWDVGQLQRCPQLQLPQKQQWFILYSLKSQKTDMNHPCSRRIPILQMVIPNGAKFGKLNEYLSVTTVLMTQFISIKGFLWTAVRSYPSVAAGRCWLSSPPAVRIMGLKCVAVEVKASGSWISLSTE